MPLNIINKDNPCCALSRSSPKAIAIGTSKAIIIDEAPMLHKKVYHAIDFSLKDVIDKDTIFGGKPILMSGDFRQILPIVIRGHRADTVNATIKRSYIWPSVEVMKLKTNMRVQRAVSDNEEQSYFAIFLNDLGDGKLEYNNNNEILIPSAIGTDVLSESQLIAAVYSDNERLRDPEWINERTILCSTNRQVKALNDKMIARCSGSSTIYISIDTVSSGENEMTFPVEVLNSIEISGLPSHTLKLKIGTPVMLMRSTEAPITVNGTRGIITHLGDNLLTVIIACGSYKGFTVHVPRMPIVDSTTNCVAFKRVQFPIKPVYAMTINKSQGQIFSTIGIDLTHKCFNHGMLYVALSRVGSPRNIFILNGRLKWYR